MSTAGERQSRVTVTSQYGDFKYVMNAMSGGGRSASFKEVYNGGADTPDLISSRPAYEDLTVSAPYDPKRSRGSVDQLVRRCGGEIKYTVTVQDLDGNGVAVGKPTVYTGCRIQSVSVPRYDEHSASEKTWSVTFKVQNRT